MIDFRVCELLLQVLAEGTPSAGERRPSLDRLDSLMHDGPRGFAGAANFAPTAFANYTIARLREAQGDLPRALAAIRRRDVDYSQHSCGVCRRSCDKKGEWPRSWATTRVHCAPTTLSLLRTAPDAPLRPQRDSVIAERTTVAARVRR